VQRQVDDHLITRYLHQRFPSKRDYGLTLASDGGDALGAEVTGLILRDCPEYQAGTVVRRNPNTLEFAAHLLKGTFSNIPGQVPHECDR
jgi:hypothetical protein